MRLGGSLGCFVLELGHQSLQRFKLWELSSWTRFAVCRGSAMKEVSPICSARECALLNPREARSIASATLNCNCAFGMAFAFACMRHAPQVIPP